MITALIFFIHLLFALIIFTKKWQEEKLSSAYANLALIGILFAVGWTISTMITKLFLEPQGFGIQFDRDAFSLTLLSISEYFFYRFYYADASTEGDKEKQ